MIRLEVAAFVELGVLPLEDSAEVACVEASRLLLCFGAGEDSCFGLAWTLLHLIDRDAR